MIDNEQFRFGSASWADAGSIRRAGLCDKHGLQLGYANNWPIRLQGDAPLITIGGAGSGKLRDLLAYVVCNSLGERLFVVDPRGELAAISIHNAVRERAFAYCWNPTGLHTLPQHRCNPLDILKLNDPRFHADCKFIVEGLIPLSGSSNGRYFEQRARDWLENIIKARVEECGSTSFPEIFRTINAIESDKPLWIARLEFMVGSRMESVRRTAGEMLTKQQDTPKEFGSIIGELYAHLGFLDDPMLLHHLDGSDFSLADLVALHQAASLFLNVPIEYVGIWSPLLRVFFTVAMLYKARAPNAPRLNMIVDEAGQMGSFDALLRAFTYGRGAGVRAWAVFQDTGQIVRNFGQPSLQGFIGSAQVRQFFGVRDYETARLVSAMLGTETLRYDDTLQQDRARRSKWETAQRFMNGSDPFEAAYDFAHHQRAAVHRSSQARALLTPDEILAMPEDRQLLFISGKNLNPIYASKHPYFERTEMAGRYLPNPYHPPSDCVPIIVRNAQRWARVITEPVPHSYAHYPQHQSGFWSFVEGFQPH